MKLMMTDKLSYFNPTKMKRKKFLKKKVQKVWENYMKMNLKLNQASVKLIKMISLNKKYKIYSNKFATNQTL